MKKLGRPVKPDINKNSARLELRCTKRLKYQIQAYCKDKGLKLSSVVINLITEKIRQV